MQAIASAWLAVPHLCGCSCLFARALSVARCRAIPATPASPPETPPPVAADTREECDGGAMVLAELGSKVAIALRKMTQATVVGEPRSSASR